MNILKSGYRPCRSSIAIIALSGLVSGCTVGLHGSFVDRSYIPGDQKEPGVLLGKVHGKSCQRNILYLFPRGEEVATDEAIQNALRQREGTDYLVDISIAAGIVPPFPCWAGQANGPRSSFEIAPTVETGPR